MDTLKGDDTRIKFLWANLQRIVDKQGRTGKKKLQGDTLQGGGKKSSFLFQEKIGVTPSVAAPGDTHPSDATASS